MYCSGCGQALSPGQAFCPQCGRPTPPPVPPIPGLQFQLESYASKIRALSVVWFIYAGLRLLLGFLGMAFAKAVFLSHLNGWSMGPFPPGFLGPALLHVAWAFLIVQSALALGAAWGLMERSPWGRILAIVAAVFSLLKFPFGTALGIWTLVLLLGYRNSSLYEQLPNGTL
jgi:hypothetical protein